MHENGMVRDRSKRPKAKFENGVAGAVFAGWWVQLFGLLVCYWRLRRPQQEPGPRVKELKSALQSIEN